MDAHVSASIHLASTWMGARDKARVKVRMIAVRYRRSIHRRGPAGSMPATMSMAGRFV
jgi:hypothetical protein